VNDPGVRLPFNGTLSEDEVRMMDQAAFEDYAITVTFHEPPEAE
jgi:hypothetical protein